MTLVSRQPGMIEADAAGELVGLHVERGTCYGFNATATRVWQLLEQPRTVDGLVAELVAEHAVDEVECRVDLQDLLRSLEGEQLVSLTPA
ncbi:PqqD family protein [Sphingomonas sp. UV9]|uniref:PqqD family protein n=1 Tax=Sphingomonas sp. UV9 TaxID=1851410 RepID=UPI0013E8BBD6|nr:PqqD family protein [Sphingomonas sp. UV9]